MAGIAAGRLKEPELGGSLGSLLPVTQGRRNHSKLRTGKGAKVGEQRRDYELVVDMRGQRSGELVIS